MQRGFNGPSWCVLCGASAETAHHVFFTCTFSRSILIEVKKWVKFRHLSCNLKTILWVMRRHYHGKSWCANFTCAAMTASIYLIWLERNNRIFSNNFKSPAVLRNLKFIVSVRMLYDLKGYFRGDRMNNLLD